MRKRELIALRNLSCWCLVMVERLFLAVPRGCLQFVIVVFPDHSHLLFLQFAIGKITSQKLLTDANCAPESAKYVSTSRTAHMRVIREILLLSLH